jgi:hypothetical protein
MEKKKKQEKESKRRAKRQKKLDRLVINQSKINGLKFSVLLTIVVTTLILFVFMHSSHEPVLYVLL